MIAPVQGGKLAASSGPRVAELILFDDDWISEWVFGVSTVLEIALSF